MPAEELLGVVDTVLRRARLQGYVVPREVRQELTEAGLPQAKWKDVLSAARESLHYRQGRYYCLQNVSPQLQKQQSQQQIVFHAVRDLIRRHQAVKAEKERRSQERIDFIYPVKVHSEDNREFRVLTRDLSPTGIRLVANRSFLGQKIRVHLATSPVGRTCTFIVRVLWACAVGDDLYENGGAFLELASE